MGEQRPKKQKSPNGEHTERHLKAIHRRTVLGKQKKRLSLPTERKRAFSLEVQERLVEVAKMIRKSMPLQEVNLEIQKRYKLSKVQASRYIRRVYEEFQSQYEAEDLNTIMAEHAEGLKEAMRVALEQGKISDYDKVSRQYAELVGVMKPATLFKVDQRDQRTQLVGTPMVLQKLMEKTDANFVERFRDVPLLPNASTTKEDSFDDASTEAGNNSSEAEV